MSQNEGRRTSRSAQSQPARAPRRVSHTAYRNINVQAPGSQARNTRPAATRAVPGSGRRTSSYGSSLPNLDRQGYYAGGSGSYTSSERRHTRGGEPLRSVSVGQVRDNRRRIETKKSRKGLFIGIFAVLLVVLVGVGVFVGTRSDLFPVSKITVSGVRHLSTEETAGLAAVPAGTTLINVDAAGIEDRLRSNPWILDAKVERRFPDTINLNITEYEIDAIIDVIIDDNDNQQTWALASDGTWLMQIPDRNSEEGRALSPQVYEDVDSVLHISSVPYGSVPEMGTHCNDPNISNALAIINGMTTELADKVKSVSAASADSTVLTLDNGIEIAFGDSSDIRDKERVCLQLMQEHPNKIAYINVRVVNKPIWRSI